MEGTPAMELRHSLRCGSDFKTEPLHKIGDFLVSKGLVTSEHIEEALEIQRKTGGRLGEILHTTFGIRSLDFYKALSSYFNLEFVDLTQLQLDTSLLNESDRQLYASEHFLPHRKSVV